MYIKPVKTINCTKDFSMYDQGIKNYMVSPS